MARRDSLPRQLFYRLLFGRSKESAERATRRYLDDINSALSLTLLDKALHQLLDGIKDVDKTFSKYAISDPSGKRVWNRDSFARYITARLPENPALTICVPLLWCTFSTGAYFPFSAPSNEPEIDVKAFKRAFAFIVTRGYELLGAMSDGRPFPTDRTKLYAEKVPRLTRIIFRSLNTLWRQTGTQSGDPQESLQVQDIQDTIAFTQPIINSAMIHGRAEVADEEFESAAHRLFLADHKLSTVKGSSNAVSKADLQSLIQLFLLQRAEDLRWRCGLSYYDMHQRSGDIMLSRFISDPDEVSRASKLASAFLAHQFPGSDDCVTWEQFKAYCWECVSTSRVFFLSIQTDSFIVSLYSSSPSSNSGLPCSRQPLYRELLSLRASPVSQQAPQTFYRSLMLPFSSIDTCQITSFTKMSPCSNSICKPRAWWLISPRRLSWVLRNCTKF
jgi:hypothetical protein